MGHAYAYRCETCGFETTFNLGHGYLIHPQPLNEYLNGSIKLFHHKTHNALKRLALKHKNLFLDASFKIYKCARCGLLHEKICVALYDDGVRVYKSEFRCTECRARLKLTNIHRLKNAICPVCRKDTFRSRPQKMVLWN